MLTDECLWSNVNSNEDSYGEKPVNSKAFIGWDPCMFFTCIFGLGDADSWIFVNIQ